MNNLDVNSVIVKHYRLHGQSVRGLIQNQQMWFLADDICSLLGYGSQIVRQFDEPNVIKLNFWTVQKKLPVLISEFWGYHMATYKYLIDEFAVSTLLMHSSQRSPLRSYLVHDIMPSVIPTGDQVINSRYQHHKVSLMRYGWRMIQSTKRSVK